MLPERPDVVLLDNMPPAMLREAVPRRNAVAPDVELEASGGINLQTVRTVGRDGRRTHQRRRTDALGPLVGRRARLVVTVARSAPVASRSVSRSVSAVARSRPSQRADFAQRGLTQAVGDLALPCNGTLGRGAGTRHGEDKHDA